MKLKEAFWDEIEEQSEHYPIEPYIPTEEVEDSKNNEPFYGDDEPAF